MTKEIMLTQGNVALVDDDDYEKVMKYNWRVTANKPPYACAKTGLLMHRLIMNTKKGEIVDHKNHNGLDNRKENLRIVTPAQNMMNRNSKNNGLPKGVEVDGNRFRARIYKDKKVFRLGYFSTAEEAGIAYDKKAIELFGEYANLNFPV